MSHGDREPDAQRSSVDGRHKALSPQRLRAEFAGLYAWLPGAERRLLKIVGLLAVFSALAEGAMIALLVPFLAYVTGTGGGGGGLPGGLTGIVDDGMFAIAALLLAALVIVSATLRYALLAAKTRLVESVAHEIGSAIYARAIGQPYHLFVTRNSSEFIAGVEKVRGLAVGVLSPAIDALTGVVMGVIIGLALVALQPMVALVAGVVLGALYLAVTRFSKPALQRSSDILSETFTLRIKMVQEGLGGIRDVKIAGAEGAMLERFRTMDAAFRDAKVRSGLITQAPAIIVEAAALAALIGAAFLLLNGPGGGAALVPLIGAMVYGLRRLMPLWQQVYLVRSSFSTYSGLLADVRELLAVPLEQSADRRTTLPALSDAITFEQVCYSYDGADEPALKGVNLVIERGARVGLMGPSGAGKSTLVDLFAGLIAPSEGRILIDGTELDSTSIASWQSQIAYVPQAIFLIDDTLAANIAFGTTGQLDRESACEAAKRAEIAEFIETLPDGYDTRVGERGVRLSGGQRQRIGLARALYRQASILILDEATSALDEATEARIIASIGRLERTLTILAIAHRASTLAFCDRLYEIDDGRVRGETVPFRDREPAKS